MTRPSKYSSEFDLELLRLWASKDPELSCSEIGARVGMTKNAAVGRLHRIGAPGREHPIRRGRLIKREKPVSRKAMPVQILVGSKTQESAPPKRYGDQTCQFPLNSKSPWVFCDSPAIDGKSWCEEHYSRVFVRRSA